MRSDVGANGCGLFYLGGFTAALGSLAWPKGAPMTTAQEFIDKQEDLLKYKELYEHIKALRAITNLN